mmetsp:Transcript_32373/g.52342  ORF Transcript_32373/g.52342 Transcript_32373/m.52342 type:complete len:187 (-) Transcript_32373:417-977(-)|eukprot:CAMPEP_0184647512 /NCGR_PEP_ID=MMETSP0308-20130426/4463_1 /TAXON_ID=38269 /ORGANISM="Gloeochaete witrockiana, Strain SAG 46.84" /LENGTH=186 /DNA_ID=CAMNT_0027078537 /DNA_START=109 /DNA_END=669 /DNA_ORIENTATION=+
MKNKNRKPRKQRKFLPTQPLLAIAPIIADRSQCTEQLTSLASRVSVGSSSSQAGLCVAIGPETWPASNLRLQTTPSGDVCNAPLTKPELPEEIDEDLLNSSATSPIEIPTRPEEIPKSENPSFHERPLFESAIFLEKATPPMGSPLDCWSDFEMVNKEDCDSFSEKPAINPMQNRRGLFGIVRSLI